MEYAIIDISLEDRYLLNLTLRESALGNVTGHVTQCQLATVESAAACNLLTGPSQGPHYPYDRTCSHLTLCFFSKIIADPGDQSQVHFAHIVLAGPDNVRAQNEKRDKLIQQYWTG